jgi:hypothetical protein
LQEENPILSKPKKLVEEFFSLAEEDSRRIVAELELDTQLINIAGEVVKPRMVNGVKCNLRLAAVDGSRCPSPSMKVGVGAAVVTAGYMVADGGSIIASDYRAKTFVSKASGRELKLATRVATLSLERKVALEALKWNPDFLIIDGSFFYPLSMAIYAQAPPYIKESVQEAHRDTSKLMDSGKAVGVIKRSSLRAIEAELLLRGKVAPHQVRGLRDKFILDVLMPERSLVRYEDFATENPVLLSLFLITLAAGGGMDEALENTRRQMTEVRRAQGIPDVELKRSYVRAFAEPPPFEVEHPPNFDVEDFAAKIIPWCNEATGLPLLLDMLDQDIGVERGLMKAYVDEVHARALDKTLKREALKSLFKQLNPEKEF